MTSSTPRLRICISGAAPDTCNHGVTALCLSTVAAFLRREPSTHITVFDNGRGLRHETFRLGEREFPIERLGARCSRRLYRSDSLWVIRASGWLGGLRNRAIRAIRAATAVLDVSGGDSFTDLYGRGCFRAINMLKHVALEQSVPLVLLPQTIGPFDHPAVRREAEALLRRAHAVWARDAFSFAELQARLGPHFDPERHRCGVDLGFDLAADDPGDKLGPDLREWLAAGDLRTVAGFNVSGWVYNDPARAAVDHGLRTDYRRAVQEILRLILEESDVNLLLVPHVAAPFGSRESDTQACEAVAGLLGPRHVERVRMLPAGLTATEVKWVIGRLGWFCGTRMHSAIASLSSGVPTAAIAYSGKTLGVVESIGQGEHVHDARTLSTDDTISGVLDSFRARHRAREELAVALPGFRARLEAQMDDIVDRCRALSRSATG